MTLLFSLGMVDPWAGIVIIKNRLIRPSIIALLAGIQSSPGIEAHFAEEFQKTYAQNKDNIKTVIRFNN